MVDSSPQRSGVPWRRIGIVATIWAALAAGVLGFAAALDTPPGAPEVVSTPDGLPPLTLSLDRALPPSVVAKTNAAEQIEELRALAAETNDAGRWVEMGAALQRLQDYEGATLAYRRALTIDSTRLDARVGAIMLDAASAEGRERAAVALAELQAANPNSQLVAFNQGMVAIYRRDNATVQSAFAVAERLGPTTTLGRLATRFRSATGQGNVP